jgi:hypothetical protein
VTEESERAALLKKFEEGVEELHRQAKALAELRERLVRAGVTVDPASMGDRERDETQRC